MKKNYRLKNCRLYLGDCLDIMPRLTTTVDMVMTDPPYGTTACKWDSIIPLDAVWSCLNALTKANAAVVMTATQPFTTILISSNFNGFRYDLKWIKKAGTGFYNANRMPLRAHEDIVLFYKKLPTYNPQKTPGKPYKIKRGSPSDVYVGKDLAVTENITGDRHPLSWREFRKDTPKQHPTQKPVALMEYLIKTYTNEGDTVLDFAMGSGTTGVACVKLNRKFIGIELDRKYFQIAHDRIKNTSLKGDGDASRLGRS